MDFKLILIIIFSVLKLEDNYLVYGSSTSNRRQSNQQQQCTLPTLANGMVRLRQRGKLAKFQCFRNYKLIGNAYAGCSGGKWDSQIPICVKSGCQNIQPPENGFIMKEHDNAVILLFCKEEYQLAGVRQIHCNGSKWDRPLGTCRKIDGIQQRTCDFEVDDLCGWIHDDTDDFEWNRILGGHNKDNIGSRRLRTGPLTDHTTLEKNTGGHYMLIESFDHLPDDKARLISPTYPSKLSNNTCFKFFYYMYGATVGNLKVYIKPISIDMETVTQDNKYTFFEMSGNQGNKWHQGNFLLENINESFQIIIEGSAGTSHLSDIAIDDVALLDDSECVNSVTQEQQSETTKAIDQQEVVIYDYQSCKNRCNETVSTSTKLTEAYERIENSTKLIKLCDCHNECEDFYTCCPDYRSICTYDENSTLPYTIQDVKTKLSTLPLSLPQTTTIKTSLSKLTIPTTSTFKTPSLSTVEIKTTTTKPTTSTIKNISSLTTPNIKSSKNTYINQTTTTISIFRSNTLKTLLPLTTKPTIRTTTTINPLFTTKTTSYWIRKRIFFVPFKNSINYSEEEKSNNSDHSHSISSTNTKEHNWNVDFDDNKDKNAQESIWLIIIISVLITGCLIAILIFGVNYYRLNYGPENYKNNINKYSNRHQEAYSDVLFLTSDEQLDFTIQRPNENNDGR